MKLHLSILLALVLLLGAGSWMVLPVFAGEPSSRLSINSFRTLGEKSRLKSMASQDELSGPNLPDTLKIVAIRVDFEYDTLTTTSGTGEFYYEIPDTVDPEDWIVDPPPHDKQYFEDQLDALHNYFNRFSDGKVSIKSRVFPPEDRAAYRLPYPIWHINYGNDDDERLNRMLTRLFVDAWTIAADSLRDEPSAAFTNSTLFVIFHAGAGNEFDTGFDTTPHDIPSVYIGPEDLATYADLPEGIPVDNGSFMITEGVILPEMQRQGDVEVGLIGTICTQVGVLMGMPHLYQPETGDPGIGMLGLMDRGFGGFFGIIPIPPSAWMREYMGWDSVTVIEDGDISLGALHLPDSLFSDDLHRLVKVPINGDEYFLLESRLRDPEEDDVTYAYDRDGRVMTFHHDYEIEAEEGFRVPVEIEDHDFDFPSSGLLIWHIDESVIRDKIDADRIQEDRHHRGVSLEEADGSEDIGEEYEFLTPGDGSEYGVREDAWYAGNEVWLLANSGSEVVFGPNTAPSTDAYSGGASHLTFYDFSSIDDTMTCKVVNAWKQGNFQRNFFWNQGALVYSTFADLDGDGIAELVLYDTVDRLRIFKGDGSPLPGIDDQLIIDGISSIYKVAAAPIDNDAGDELVIAADSKLIKISYDRDSETFDMASVSIAMEEAVSLLISGPFESPITLAAYRDPNHDRCYVYKLEDDFSQANIDSFAVESDNVRMVVAGTQWSTIVAIVDNYGNLVIYHAPMDDIIEIPLPGSMDDVEIVNRLLSGDIDGGGAWDIIAACDNQKYIQWYGEEEWENPEVISVDVPLWKHSMFDLDNDGLPELAGISANGYPGIYGIEPSGIWTEDTPVPVPHGTHWAAFSPLVVDFEGDGHESLIMATVLGDSSGYGVVAIDLLSERTRPGFPIDYAGHQQNLNIAAGQIDEDANIELIMTSSASGDLKVVNIPIPAGDVPEIIWGMDGGNPRLTGHYYFPSAQGSAGTGATIESAYCWPNPVKDDEAHFRFRPKRDGVATLKIFDLVGREVEKIEQSVDGGLEQEIVVNCEDIPSGVYVARLETGGEYKIIRFAVVQ